MEKKIYNRSRHGIVPTNMEIEKRRFENLNVCDTDTEGFRHISHLRVGFLTGQVCNIAFYQTLPTLTWIIKVASNILDSNNISRHFTT